MDAENARQVRTVGFKLSDLAWFGRNAFFMGPVDIIFDTVVQLCNVVHTLEDMCHAGKHMQGKMRMTATYLELQVSHNFRFCVAESIEVSVFIHAIAGLAKLRMGAALMVDAHVEGWHLVQATTVVCNQKLFVLFFKLILDEIQINASVVELRVGGVTVKCRILVQASSSMRTSEAESTIRKVHLERTDASLIKLRPMRVWTPSCTKPRSASAGMAVCLE